MKSDDAREVSLRIEAWVKPGVIGDGEDDAAEMAVEMDGSCSRGRGEPRRGHCMVRCMAWDCEYDL